MNSPAGASPTRRSSIINSSPIKNGSPRTPNMSRSPRSPRAKSPTSPSAQSTLALQDDLVRSNSFIEEYIAKNAKQYQGSELFQTLQSLHELFKSELLTSVSLRQTLAEQKQEIANLRDEIEDWREVLQFYSGAPISTINEAQILIDNERRQRALFEERTEATIAQLQADLTLQKQNNEKLKMENRDVTSKINVLADQVHQYEIDYTKLCKQLQNDTEKAKREVSRLESEKAAMQTEINQLRVRNGDDVRTALDEICDMMKIDKNLSPRSIIRLVKKFLVEEDDSKPTRGNSRANIRPTMKSLAIVAITCNRLYGFIPNDSGLLSQILRLKGEIKRAKQRVIL